MGIFCKKHSNTEESISVIAEILSNNDPKKFKDILKEFKSLGFNKVKDLAQATLGKANQMSLGDDPIGKLYGAMQIYDKRILYTKKFESAKSLYDKGYYIKAQEECETLYRLQPDNVNVILLLSASFYMQKEYEKSIESLKKIPPKYQQCVEVLNNLGSNSFRQNQIIQARDYYLEALKKNQVYIDCWINCFKVYMKMKDYSNAILCVKMMINYKRNLIVFRHLYGKLLIILKEVKQAITQFKLAIYLDPESASSWVHLGNCYSSINKMNKATKCYEKALEIDKELITPRINLGIAYCKLKKYNDSIKSLKSVLQLCPEDMNILKILACVYISDKNIPSALNIYSLCLKKEPNNPDLYYELGVLYFSNLDNSKAAEPYFKKCIDLDPDNIEYYRCLALVYQDQNKNELAFKTAIKMGDMYVSQKDFTNARNAFYYAFYLCPHDNYGHQKLEQILSMLEHDGRALMRYERVKELTPNFSLNLSNIALICEEENQLKTAEKHNENTLQLNSVLGKADHDQMVLQQQKGNDDVIALYNLTTKHKLLDSFEVHKTLGNYFYKEVGNFKEAHSHFVKALKINDINLDDYITLGNLSLELKNNDEALTYFHKAIKINPECIMARISIGCIYKDKELYNEAIKEFEEVLNLQPGYPDALSNLFQCQQHICKYINKDSVKKLKEIVDQQFIDNKVPCVSTEQSLLYDFKPEMLLYIASKYTEQFVKKPCIERNLSRRYVHERSLSSNGCIRVGYICSNFSIHPILELIKSIRKLHDEKKVEVFCYSLSPINTPGTNNLSASDFIDISNLNSIEKANKINSDGIHILVDVNSSIKDFQYELFALRPAPIQVKLLGHPGTTGATFMDYLITDKECSPPRLHCFYSEKLAYLNRTVFFSDNKLLFNDLSQRNPQNRTYLNNFSETMGVGESEGISYNTTSMYSVQILPDDSIKCYTRQMYNLPEDYTVFCNFGQLYKIDKNTLKVWITILKSVANSVLWLLRFSKDAENNIHKFVTMNGIDPARVIFSNLASKDEHMRRIQLADVFLDTLLFGGHKSCLDALWAGTPVITLSGDTFASRMATSQLTALDCTETIAQYEYEYVKIAFNLGSTKPLLDRMRRQIWQSKTTSPLFDCKSYAENLEIVYSDMWNQLSLSVLD